MPSALTDHLGYWLRTVSNHVSQGFAARLAKEGTSIAEWVMLREMLDGPELPPDMSPGLPPGLPPSLPPGLPPGLPPSVLASRMGLSRGAVTKLADRLIARGLITRAADAADGRGRRLCLTGAGRALVPRLAALADRNDADAFGHLPPEDRSAMERILRVLSHHHRLTKVPIE